MNYTLRPCPRKKNTVKLDGWSGYSPPTPLTGEGCCCLCHLGEEQLLACPEDELARVDPTAVCQHQLCAPAGEASCGPVCTVFQQAMLFLKPWVTPCTLGVHLQSHTESPWAPPVPPIYSVGSVQSQQKGTCDLIVRLFGLPGSGAL